jgi:uncharacterized membrane protein YhaH (DUF805 family)
MDPLIELFSLDGRVNRGWYFLHVLLDDLVILTMVIVMLTASVVLGTPLLLLPILGVILGGVWAAMAVTVKRLHDLGRPGWHVWAFMVPIYNIYLGLLLVFGKGTVGPNQFGPDPLGVPEMGGYIEG